MLGMPASSSIAIAIGRRSIWAELGEEEAIIRPRNRDRHGMNDVTIVVDRRQRTKLLGDRIPDFRDDEGEAEGLEGRTEPITSARMTPLSSPSTTHAAPG